jgi:NAD+ kinase
MKAVAIFSRALSLPYTGLLQEMVSMLLADGIKIFLHENVLPLVSPAQALQIEGTFSSANHLEAVDVLLSVGGDGTFLEAMLHTLTNDIPVMGINSGRLGFLADVPIEEYAAAIRNLKNNHYTTEARTLLSVDGIPQESNEIGRQVALNEFTITKRDTSSMLVIHTKINGEHLNSYWADGIIVSSATGSTGYSLSCGGPILTPDCNNFIITPISPHNLNVRPLVVPDSSVVEFKIEGRADYIMIALDSRSQTLPIQSTFTVQKAAEKCKIVRLSSTSFTDALKKKLLWGKDLRN